MPSTTPLTDAINALTTYANETTGASDTTLSAAVGSLVAGYGGGGGSGNVKVGTFTLASNFALAATPAAFTPVKLSFKPDFFWMSMNRASWDSITTPSGGIYNLLMIDKDYNPPVRLTTNISTDSATGDYVNGMTTAASASTDVSSNGYALNGNYATIGKDYQERFYFDSNGQLYVGRYSSAATNIIAGTYYYVAAKYS